MSKLRNIAVAATLGLGLLSTSAFADASKGQRIFSKKLKEVCGYDGAVFAAKHSQMEWQEAYESDSLKDLMIDACPAGEKFFNSSKFEKKFKQHMYEFVFEYANDSGNVPSC